MFSMRWAVILLIFAREVRDQLRDRRTLFMIFVLPIMLYPLLSIGMLKLGAAFEQKPRKVVLVGAEALPATPPLLNPAGDRFDPRLFDVASEAALYHVERAAADSAWAEPAQRAEFLRRGDAAVAVLIPANVAQLVADEAVSFRPGLAYDSAEEQSRAAARVVREVFEHWNEVIVRQRLTRDAKPAAYLQAVQPELVDVARTQGAAGSVWARLFPFILVIMALTGAFYPSIDLCAGEKERGTMETLLISPATRPEIVVGKFLTVMLASIATALLNLASMGVTAQVFFSKFAARGRATGNDVATAMTAPSLESVFWMIVLLVPLAAFFSALCLALAAMARSVKEGQYYLTPLYVVALPLIFATLIPGIELDLSTSLVPVTGASLLLRSLMLGKYEEARRYFLPVLVPLLVYSALALRWAVGQFLKEAVLFREAEKFDLRGWLTHLVREREPTPRGGQPFLCFALMLISAWFSIGWMGGSWQHMIAGQLFYVLLPTLVLTFLLTSSPRRTLRLTWPHASDLLLAVSLALALNPVTHELGRIVSQVFPMSELQKSVIEQIMGTLPGIGALLLAFAFVPAVCEELAFRGFILSGLEDGYRRWSAVVLSAFLFGFLHVLLSFSQQLINATLMGVVLALLAIRSRSILPGIILHVINNGLAVGLNAAIEAPGASGLVAAVFRDPQQGLYHGPWVALGGLVSAVLLVALARDATRAPADPGMPPSSREWDSSPAPPPRPDGGPHERAEQDGDTGRALDSAGRRAANP